MMLVAVTGLLWFGVRSCRWGKTGTVPTKRGTVPGERDLVLVTGYCSCEKCCGWKRSWFGFGPPVYTYGVMKGRRKEVGVTASGTTARRGTIAADPSVFGFGTKLDVPGYGIGTVEDVGGAIKGKHIDVWFPTHAEALKWGRKWLKVRKR